MENILNDIKIPIIVWKNMECIFTNNTLCSKGEKIDDYIKKTDIINLKHYIDLLNQTKTQQIIRTPSEIITFEYISNDYFYEIRYPNNDNNDLLQLVIYKFRTPLSTIINILSNENNYLLTYDKIKNSCYNMMSIINDLIDIININKNTLKCNNKIFNIEMLLHESIKFIEDDANKKFLSITYNISNELDKLYYQDYDKLKQIIINILSNSVKYTIVGGISIEIKPYKNNKCPLDLENHNILNNIDNLVLFKIKDTGAGITDENKIMIDNLLNISKTNNKKYKLKGFGLYISYYFCKFLNGLMWYKSEKDMGTIFYIVIPLLTP